MSHVLLPPGYVEGAAHAAGLHYVPSKETVEVAMQLRPHRSDPGAVSASLADALALYCRATNTIERTWTCRWVYWQADENMRASVARRMRIDLAEMAMRNGAALVGPLQEVHEVTPALFRADGQDRGGWMRTWVDADGTEQPPPGLRLDAESLDFRVRLLCPTRPMVVAAPPRPRDAEEETQAAPEMYLFGP